MGCAERVEGLYQGTNDFDEARAEFKRATASEVFLLT